MDNVHKQKRFSSYQEASDMSALKQEKRKSIRTSINSESFSHFKKRLNSFVKGADSKGVLESFRYGAIPLLNPSLHDHRDRRKSLEKDPLGGIYVKNFYPGKERASMAQSEFINGYLSNELFDPTQPHKSYANWLRARDIKKEGTSVRYGLRTENENITSTVLGNLAKLDHSPRQMKMVHSPTWKENVKSKWIEPNNGFKTGSKQTLNLRSDPPWPVVQVKSTDPYIGGFEEIEQTLGRSRDKSKEQKKVFIAQIKNDPWESTLNLSKSIRAFKADQVMRGDENQLLFSKNNKLNDSTYKSSLLQTGSVDYSVPFIHSNNYQGIPLKDVGQNYPKTYKLSLVQYGMAEIGSQDIAANHRRNGENLIDFDYQSKEIEEQMLDSTSPSRREDTQRTHTISTMSQPKFKDYSFQKAKKNLSLVASPRLNFKYDPPTDQLVQETVSKYFKSKQE